MKEQEPLPFFLQGPIPASLLADVVQAQSSNGQTGAHAFFLGQVRADVLDGKTVKAIEYTGYKSMVTARYVTIREAVMLQYGLTHLQVYHSLGTIAAGQLCLLVFTAAPHRKAALEACSQMVEHIKRELPIWGKEIFLDDTHQWKENK